MSISIKENFSLDYLKKAGAEGLVADVTDRLGGESFEMDYPSRGPRESKLKLLKISGLKNCLPPRDLHAGDVLLIFNADAEVIYAGKIDTDGRLLHRGGGKSALSAAAYCARWRSAAGVKVLRAPWWKYRYTKRECMVPMRDGKRLYTAVYEPVGVSGRPILLQRSPYPCCPFGTGGPADIWDNLALYADNAYIIVYQNVRGTYLSEGEFENVRPLGGSCDEATDAFDTIEWLLANTLSNGRVGIFGVSYPGFYSTCASLCKHPALKAVSPQAPVTDWWKGDDLHHNGSLCLADTYSFGGFFFQPKGNPTPDSPESIAPVPEDEDLRRFFGGKSIKEILRPLGNVLPFMESLKAHPDYDAFWQERNPLGHIRERTFDEGSPAIMVVGGLYDAEDGYGAVETYKAYKKAGARCRFVYGPWTHGGWRKNAFYLQNIEYPFFAHYLEEKGPEPPRGEFLLPTGIAEPGPVGENQPWVAGARADGGVSPIIPQCCDFCAIETFAIAPGKFVSNPFKPVPYMDIRSSRRDKAYMWAEQNFASRRRDVLCRVLHKPLKDSLSASGPIVVHIEATVQEIPSRRAATPAEKGRGRENGYGTLLDADFAVKLIDVAPDGRQNLVRADIFPARYRNSFEKPEPIKSGEPFSLDFEMTDICHIFRPGHGIMVQIQGSMFPLFAANPQTFLENPMNAEAGDYKPVKISILPGSRITLLTAPAH